MANTINNVNDAAAIIAKMAAKLLADEMHFCKGISKAPAEDYNGKNGYKAGTTIQISKPARFVPQTTFDISSSKQDIVEEKTALTLDIISTVGVTLDSLEISTELGIEQAMERVVKPAVSSIAQDVEQRFLEKATDATYNSYGTAGSGAFGIADILGGRALLNRNLCPKDNERSLLLDSSAGALAVTARSGLFQSSEEISKQYKTGLIGLADGFKWVENELLTTHTNGNDVTGVNVDGATQSGATINMQGFTANSGTITKGSVFTIAGVYMVHPITKDTTGNLQQFVATADGTADANGDIAVALSPSIVASGSLQNVDAVPADTAALVFVGAASTGYSQSLGFHKDAFRMVSVPLEMPKGAEFAGQATVDGITVAIVRDFDVETRSFITRIDFLGGLANVRPEWAVRYTA